MAAMKNATDYQKTLRKLLSDVKPVEPEPFEGDVLEAMVRAIVSADATERQTDKALAGLQKEFVDINELRVGPPKDIADALGRDHPRAREKAHELREALGALFTRVNALSLDHAEEMTKRDLRRHLEELTLSPYAAAWMVLHVFGGHAIPVDESTVEYLRINDCVDPEAELADIQGFLERAVLQKDALGVHRYFRSHVAEGARALARRRRAEAREAERQAKKQAAKEAREQKKREQKAAAEKAKAEKKAQAEKAKAKKSKAAKKATKRKTTKRAKKSSSAKRSGKTADAKAKPRKKAAKRKSSGRKTAKKRSS